MTIEICTSEHNREYHLRQPIQGAKPFEIASALASISNLPGVDVATAPHRHTLSIWKGPAFTWEEVEPAILEALKSIGEVL
jgi:hypothetical protein